MDARALGSAMYSTAMAIEHSAAILYGPTTELRIEVNADFRHGSFAYELLTSPEARDWAGAALYTAATLTVPQLRELVARLREAITLVKWLRRGPITETLPMQEGGQDNVIVRSGDNTTVVHAKTLILARNAYVREDLGNAVKPVAKPGINEVSFRGDGEPATVAKGEETYFEDLPGDEEPLHDAVNEEILVIVSPTFEEGKWRFARPDGSHIWAQIADEDYLQKVRASPGTREVFGWGDALLVQLRTVVTRNRASGKFKSTFEVMRVIRKIEPPQTDMFAGESSPSREA